MQAWISIVKAVVEGSIHKPVHNASSPADSCRIGGRPDSR